MVVLFERGRPRRKPYPDDFVLDTLRGRLGYSKKNGTQLVAVVPPDQAQVAPTEFGESAENPVFGAAYAYRNFTRGMGQRRLRGKFQGRVHYCLNARTRPGYLLKGPSLTSYTPATRDTTNGVTRFFEIGSKIYALNGRYALDGSTDGTGWTVSKDFGASDRGFDVAVAQQNGTGTTRYAFVGLGDSTAAQKFDGTTWTTWTSINARALVVAEEEFWLADSTNRLKSCDLDADPTNSANWVSSTERIGSGDHNINRLAVDAAGGLVIAKADDLYTVDAEGEQHRLFGAFQFPPASTNGEALGRYGNNLYVTYGNMGYRLGPDGGLLPVGVALLRDNGSDVRGYETAWCGTDFFALVGIWNPDDSTAYLMEFTNEFVENDYGQKEPVWHGSITASSTTKITAIHQSTIGAATSHKLAYVGYANGTIAKYALACTPDPADCDQERFSTADGSVYLPRTYFFFPGEHKALHAATGEGDNLSAANYATLSYRTTGTAASYTSIGTSFKTDDRQAVNFADGTSCTYLDPLLTLTNAASTASPQVTGLTVEWELRTSPKQVFSLNILAEDGLRKRDGTPYRLGADAIRDLIETLAGEPAAVEFVDPEERSRQVTVKMPRRVVAYDELRKPRNAIQVTLVETRLNDVDGTLDTLAGLTLAEMAAYTLTQLANL